MKLQIIKTQNGKEMMNFSRELTSSDDLMSIIENIKTYANWKKAEIISNDFPFEEINNGDSKVSFLKLFR